jgi:hypothetical protein
MTPNQTPITRSNLRTRAVLGGAVATAIAVGCLPAQAEAFAGQHREARGSVRVLGVDGVVYRLDIDAHAYTAASGAYSGSLSISIASCPMGSCGTAVMYSQPITSSQLTFSADATTVTVSTRFGGAPVTLAWAVGQSTGSVGVQVGNADGGVSVGDPKDGGTGTLSAAIVGVSGCPGIGLDGDASPMVLSTREVQPDGVASPGGAAFPGKLMKAFTKIRGKAPKCVRTTS